MHMDECLHPWVAIERLYLRRGQSGRSFLNIVEMHDRISVGMATSYGKYTEHETDV